MKVQIYEWLRMRYEKAYYGYVTQCAFSVKRASEDSTRHFAISNLNPWRMYVIGKDGVLSYYDGTSHTTKYTEPIYIDLRGDTTKVNGEDIGVPCNASVIIGDAQRLDITDYLYSAISFKDGRVWKPCKLIEPYKGHQAGECAFVEEDSNKLYFDPTNTGAFSVEGEALEVIDTSPCYNNIISKESTKAVRLREWLKGDSKAWIDTDITFPNTPLDVSVKTILYPSINGSYSFVLFSARSGTLRQPYVHCNPRYDDMSIYNDMTDERTFIAFKFGEVVDLSQKMSNNTSNGRLQLFHSNQVGFGNNYLHASLSSLEIKNDVGLLCHLHPAELALPYDNHPIGECCMIDLNSGDLYFNQGSGQFSCEGAFLGYWQDKPMNDHYCDVEGTLHRSVQIFADNGERLALIWEKSKPWTEHRWLTFDIPMYKSSQFNGPVTIPITYAKFRASGESTNAGLLLTRDSLEHYAYQHAATLQVTENNAWRIWSTEGRLIKQFSSKSNVVSDILLENNTIFVNGESANFDLNRPIAFSIFNSGNAGFVGKISKVETDVYTLTPAVLNRPTLASEDNNGISRKQGEAVFVDYERYKQGLPWCFGNVASSGSFSVSDYLIEGEDYEVISGVIGNDDTKLYLHTAEDVEMRIIPYDIDVLNSKSKYCRIIYFDQISGGWDNTRAIAFNNGATNDNVIGFAIYRMQANFENGLGFNVENNKEYVITCNDGVVKVNGLSFSTTIPKYNAVIIGYSNYISNNVRPFAITSFKSDTLNIIPVRLLRNIEPYTTHNGKGGKANEIGFFDTISGKFYGNDGSGEFSEYVAE